MSLLNNKNDPAAIIRGDQRTEIYVQAQSLDFVVADADVDARQGDSFECKALGDGPFKIVNVDRQRGIGRIAGYTVISLRAA